MTQALTRPNLIARAVSLIALVGAVILLVLILSGGSSYELRLQMSNANGIRPGSQVLLGGVSVGTVRSVDLGPHDSVIATLNLNRSQIRIGQGVSASIIAANLLGEEYVSLRPGNPSQPLPSGTLVPQSKIDIPTDLDQIVDVFDAPTRERLAILINEMGIAIAGRRSDISATLRQLPLSVQDATSLLTQLVQDNHTLADVVANSNQFIARIDQQKGDLGHVVDAASGAATTAALQAGNLSQTLIDAPRALTTLRSFITNFGQTALDLTPAAAQIEASARPLNALLGQVRPFERAAVPALNEAASVAPLLTKLGEKATPIINKAVPTVSALANIAKLAYPLTYWLKVALPDVLGVAEGWDRSIQFRDGLGHVFHAEVDISPSVVVNLTKIGLPPADRGRSGASGQLTRQSPARSRAGASTQSRSGTTQSGSTPGTTGSQAPISVPGLLKTLTGSSGGGSGAASGGSAASSLSGLLNYLIGK